MLAPARRRPSTRTATTPRSPSWRPRCSHRKRTDTTPSSDTTPHAPATFRRNASRRHHARPPPRRSPPAAPTTPAHPTTPDPVSPSHPNPQARPSDPDPWIGIQHGVAWTNGCLASRDDWGCRDTKSVAGEGHPFGEDDTWFGRPGAHRRTGRVVDPGLGGGRGSGTGLPAERGHRVG